MEIQVHCIHGMQDNDYTDLLQAAERGAAELTEVQLRAAASTIEDGERHVRLSTDLRYILINTTTGSAATVCRQYQHTIGFEVYRQLCIRFSIPLGTRSIGHLTRWLKPTFDKNNFEESFSTWEFELQRFERDNGQTLPDSVKIAVLLNETSGPLEQHLQLLSGQSPNYARVKQTIIEYYRSTTAFSKLQQLRSQSSSVATSFGGGQAPMDIDAIHKGKGKYNSYKGKGKYNSYKGKGKGKTEDTTATATTVTTPTTKEKESMEEKDSTTTTIVRSASAIHSEEATKETKDSANDTTREKERTKENKQQIRATDVDEQDILPKTAEWQYTTLDKEKAMTLKTRQRNGTMITLTMDGTVRTTRDNNKDNSHWRFRQFHPPATTI